MVEKKQTNTYALKLASLAVGLSVTNASALNDFETAPIQLEKCYAKNMSEQMYCGKVTRQLDPQNEGETIDIHFAIIPALKRLNVDEAVLGFAGGPGQSAIETASQFNLALKDAKQTRDILLVDQRGTGLSTQLSCDASTLANDFAIDDSVFDAKTLKEDMTACKESINVDFSHFDTQVAAADFDAVREALGYNKLHLLGISYGTRIAQEYMRQFPSRVATATLDGVVPFQQSFINIGSFTDSSINSLFTHCKELALCDKTYPTLEQDWQQLLAKLEAKPVTTQVEHPKTGESIPFVMTKAKAINTIRGALYINTFRRLVPYAIQQATLGNYKPIVGLSSSGSFGDMADGMYLAVMCAEEWPRLSNEVRANNTHFVSQELAKAFDVACPVLNVGKVEQDYYEALESDIPTLLLSGALDPATPPQWAELAMEKMSNAKHIVAPYASHGVSFERCASKLIAELIDGAKPSEIDGECLQVDKRRGYFLNVNGSVVAEKE